MGHSHKGHVLLKQGMYENKKMISNWFQLVALFFGTHAMAAKNAKGYYKKVREEPKVRNDLRMI